MSGTRRGDIRSGLYRALTPQPQGAVCGYAWSWSVRAQIGGAREIHGGLHSERPLFPRRPSGGRGRILFGVATSTRTAPKGSPQACDQTPRGHGAPPVHASAAGPYSGGAPWIFLLGKRRSERDKRLWQASAAWGGPTVHQNPPYFYASAFYFDAQTARQLLALVVVP